MSITPTFPGVYIQELPSAVHTIVGVPTSVAAFVGFAARGLVDTPVQCNSWADYERAFGGLDPNSPMSYAAFLFFLNGGNSAQVVRAGDSGKTAAAARIALSADVFLLAVSPGTWGDNLLVTVDTTNLQIKGNFNLTIADSASNISESYTGVNLGSITNALASSALMNVDSTSGLSTIPSPGGYTMPGGAAAKAAAALAAAGPPPATTPATTSPATTSPATTTPPATTPATTVAAKPPPATLAGSNLGVDIPLANINVPGDQGAKTGIYALVKADIFNMLCLPSVPTQTWSPTILSEAAAFCAAQRAMLIIDPPSVWSESTATPLTFEAVAATPPPAIGGADPGAPNAAIYFPNLLFADPVTGTTVPQGPCGAVAGVWASTDDARGVWKAPAGTAAGIAGISDLAVHIDDGESGVLNPLAVNCLRTLPLFGPVSWGARTAAGADELGSQWKYIPVRRTALFIEESLRRGTQWVVFEPNDEPLWSAVRLNITAFMNGLFKKGAFEGSTPAQAYLVKCDADNNPQSSINQGILNILVGFQPLLPAEFVIIQIQQLAGQLSG